MSEAKFTGRLYYGSPSKIERDGYTLVASVDYDEDMGEPWKEHDGHGPVSEWTRRDKRPGERVLCTDGARGMSKRYYDYEEAIKIAKRDGWDAEPYGTGTPGQKAKRAVDADFRNLKAWCDNEWHWVFVTVRCFRAGVELSRESLGGIDSSDDDYLVEVANELIESAIEAAGSERKRIVAELA